MSFPILSVNIASERDTVSARQRARQIAKLLGFDHQDQTRISTAVSEIARNAFNYAGRGRVEYRIEGRFSPQLFLIKVTDSGPGIADLDRILEGRYQSATGMGLGIIGARRLMDQFQIESTPGAGTTVWLKKLLPNRAPVVQEQELSRLVAALARESPQDPFHELQFQNQELLSALHEVQARQLELKRVNRELEDTNRGVVALYAELDEKADHLRRADELKSRFLSNMSHEFRSPLNSILALSGLLLDHVDGQLSAEQELQVGYMRRAAQDLLELVNDLLDLAKVEAGKTEVRPTEFFVSDLFGALRGMLRPLLLNQSVDLVFEDVDQVASLYSDEGKVSQILRNFISNALKFTERGEVRVSAASTHEGHVVFSVSDTGIGIAPENLELIFQDFTQLDSPIQRKVKGTGLGLPLSKKLAELLGGEVRVKSRLGNGSEFCLEIPLRYHAFVKEPAAVIPATRNLETSGLPVLIVEDSPEVIIAYKSFLQGSAFQALPAVTIREAEQILDQVRPAAIVLDLVLRAEDAWSFLARLKEDSRTKDIPVLIASTTEDQGKAFHLGAADYLLKPIDRSTFLSRLCALTGQTTSARVLIVDDEESERYLIRQQLKDYALIVTEASSGAEGILRALEDKPDVIVLDLGMPGMTGFEVLDRLKNNESSRDIPVLICTSRILTPAEQSRLQEMAAGILRKEQRVAQALHQILDGLKSVAVAS